MEQGAEGEGDEDEDEEMNQNEAVDDGECLFLNTLFLFMYASRCLASLLSVVDPSCPVST